MGLSGVWGLRRWSSWFPPSTWLCEGRGQSGCGGSHLPPLRKVTSWSSTLGSPFPTGFPQGVGSGFLGCVFSSLRVTSWQRSSMSCHNSSSARSPRFAWNWHGVLPPRGWSLGECWGFPTYLGLEVGHLKVPHPLPLYRLSHGWQKVKS